MGTAAWVLSKPVTRSAFLTAKAAASTTGVICLMILLPGLIAHGLFRIFEPGTVTAANFAGMLSVVTLHTLFYLTLTLLLGVLVDNRFLLAALWQMNRVEF